MPEMGEKHECPNCGTKFYDLGKPEPICPRCDLNLNEAEGVEAGPKKKTARKKKKKKKKSAAKKGDEQE